MLLIIERDQPISYMCLKLAFIIQLVYRNNEDQDQGLLLLLLLIQSCILEKALFCIAQIYQFCTASIQYCIQSLNGNKETEFALLLYCSIMDL